MSNGRLIGKFYNGCLICQLTDGLYPKQILRGDKLGEDVDNLNTLRRFPMVPITMATWTGI